jgi:hypothetical protein
VEYGIMGASMHRFSANLLRRFNELGIDVERFAAESDLDAQSLRAWLQNGPDSALTRSHVNCISWWLDILADQKGIVVERQRRLKVLLEAAGYTPIGPEHQRRPVSVGYLDVPPLAMGPSGTGEPRGFAVAVTKDIASLAGWDLDWRRFTAWPALLRAVSTGAVDLVCPILVKLPSRQFHAQYSRSVPGREFTVNVLVSRTSPNDFISVDQRRLLVTHIEGEMGETLCREILPNAIFEKGFPDVASLREHLLRNKPPARFYRCVVAGEILGRELQRAHPGKFTQLALEKPTVGFEVAFATPLHNNGLIPTLDKCISELDSEGRLNLCWAEAGVPATTTSISDSSANAGVM